MSALADRVAANRARLASLEARHGLTFENGMSNVRWDCLMREMYVEEDAADRAAIRRALGHLWTAPLYDGTGQDCAIDGDVAEMPLWRRGLMRLGCSLAILLGRRLGDNGLDALGVLYFDHATLYAGWSAQFLRFDPRRLRFEVYRDGDWHL
ncbi:hypothetical protein [Brevundimonas sp.]|uniref:hypothetical protein n=1 Tax=Brevundimonas sp. TaxID=1871086 RepID=UPI002D3C8B23|nr:hypothetical protein [Brevundimonas sp.]HYD26917.1 hypothetical protein [Brevundimonas sp.]